MNGKSMKRALAMLLCLAMLLPTMPVGALAADDESAGTAQKNEAAVILPAEQPKDDASTGPDGADTTDETGTTDETDTTDGAGTPVEGDVPANNDILAGEQTPSADDAATQAADDLSAQAVDVSELLGISLEENPANLTLGTSASLVSDLTGGQAVRVTGGWVGSQAGGVKLQNAKALLGTAAFTLAFNLKIMNVDKAAANWPKEAALYIGTSANSIRVLPLTGKLGYGGQNGGASVSTAALSASPTADQWCALALVYEEDSDGGKVSLYMNGEQILAPQAIGFQLSTMDSVEAMLGRGSDTSFLLNGDYDEIVVQHTAMTAESAVSLTADRLDALRQNALWSGISLPADPISANLTLPQTAASGEAITWTSGDPTILSDQGEIAAFPSEDTAVTMTASAEVGDATYTREFTVTVAGMDNVLQEACDAIVIPNADNIKGNITLPTQGLGGAAIEWSSPDNSADGVVTLSAQGNKPAGVVTRAADGDKAVNLTATVTLAGQTATKDIPLTVKQAPQDLDTEYTNGYLWTCFGISGGYEKIFLGASTDGLQWSKLNKDAAGDAQPILSVDTLDGSDKGVRDPHLIRSAEGDKYWLLGTDLHAEGGGAGGSGWNSHSSSKNLLVWESEDLVNWSEPRLVPAGLDTAGCVWAPEAIYDEEQGDYLVYWSAHDESRHPNDPLCVYVSRTRDFYTFTEPTVWLKETGDASSEPNIIDTTVVYDEDDGYYYRFSTSDWNTVVDRSSTLSTSVLDVSQNKTHSADGAWERVVTREGSAAAGFDGREGFTVYQLAGGRWCAMGDNSGYKAFVTDDLSGGVFTGLSAGSAEGQYQFDSTFRHGTVTGLSKTEWDAVMAAYGPKARPDSNENGLFYAQDFSAQAGEDLALLGSAKVESGALVLDGTNGTYASLPAGWMDGLDTATISFRVKTELSSGAFFTFAIGQDSNKYMFMRAKGSELYTAITTSSWGGEAKAIATLPESAVGQWKNVSLVFDGDEMYLYVDGVCKAKNLATNMKLTELGAGAKILFGKSMYAGDGAFKGAFDDIQLYDRALSAKEIAQQNGVSLALINGATIGTYPVEAVGLDEHTAVASWMNENTISSYVKKYTFSKDGNTQELTDLTRVPVTFTSEQGMDAVKITLDGAPFSNGDAVDLSLDRAFTVTNTDGSDTLTVTVKTPVLASNSVLPGQFSDPDIDKFGDKYWIFPTTDGFSGWGGTQFHAFSADNLSGPWTDEGVILETNKDNNPGKNINDADIPVSPWSTGNAWAPSIEQKNGKYYFYYCAAKTDGSKAIGVAWASNPAGPYTVSDAPLIGSKPNGISMGQNIDPSIFTDTDGKSYLYWGNGNAAVVELGDDMVSIKESTAKNLTGLTGFRESVTVVKTDELYHFLWSVDDTGSPNYAVYYGTATNPYGPVTYRYPLLKRYDADNLLGTAHQSVLMEDGKAYLAYHRFYTPLNFYTSGLGYHRETCINEVPFDENGLMMAIRPTMQGLDGDIVLADGSIYTDNWAEQQDYAALSFANMDDIRGNISLPTAGKHGTGIVWSSPDGSADGVIALTATGEKPAGVVTRPAAGQPAKAVTLKAVVGSKEKTFALTVQPLDDTLDTDYTDGYLFAYFRSDDYDGDGIYQEEIYFGNSDDGLHWNNLNEKKGVQLPVLKSGVGTKGVRDPHLIRSAEGDRYWIIATDLRIEASAPAPGWGDVQTNGSQSLVIWESTDLVNWSEPRLSKINFDTAGCTWAPEAIYNDKTGEYLVYFASRDNAQQGSSSYGHRIYYITTRDFQTFSEPKVYVDYLDTNESYGSTPHETIDTTIVKDGDTYYRFSKNESSGQKYIFIEKSSDLLSGWTRVHDMSTLKDVEGATVYQLPDGKWCAMLDNWTYYPVVADSLEAFTQGNYKKLGASEYSFPNGFRHGTVVRLSQTEYDAVNAAYANEQTVRPPAGEDGLFYDQSFDAAGDDLTLNGSARVTDGALVLDGAAGGYASLPAGWMNGLDAATISFDVKTEKKDGDFFTFAIGQDSNQYLFLRTREKSFYTAITKGSYGAESKMTATLPQSALNQWRHVTLVFDGNRMQIYVDGVLAAQNEATATKLSDLGENAKILFGKSFYSGDGAFQGSFDNLRMFEQALTAEQIKGLSAQNAVNNLTIANADAIIGDFTLPEIEGVSIVWSSDHTALAIENGIAKVANVDVDTQVTLTATITKDGKTATKDFVLTLLAGASRMEAAKNALAVPYYLSQEDALPTQVLSADVSWSAPTFPDSGISEPQTLTATISLGSETAQKTFTIQTIHVAGTLLPYVIAGSRAVPGQAGAMSFAVREGDQTSLLNKGKPVLYSKHLNSGKALPALSEPWVLRKADGSFGVAAIAATETGTILLYDSPDLTTFTGERAVKLSDAPISQLELVYGGDGAYHAYWRSGVETLEATSADLVTFSAPKQSAHTFAVAQGAPEVAAQVGVTPLTASELQKIHARFDTIVNTGVTKPGNRTVNQGEALPALPDSITAQYSDGSTKQFGVLWDTSEVDTATQGTYTATATVQQPDYADPLIEERADPYIVYNEDDGYYYFTASYPQVGSGGAGYDRIVLRRAKTVQELADAEEHTVWTVRDGYDKFIWAPELHKIGDSWYILTTARRAGQSGNFSICPIMIRCSDASDMLNADSWTTQERVRALDGDQTFTGMSLDMTYFEAGGKHYLVWADSSRGESSLLIATIDPANPTQLTSAATVITAPEYSWERYGIAVNEGASVVRRDGKIHLAFSAASTGSEYCVGVMTADENADLLSVSNWTKSASPIMTTSDFANGLSGPGHNSFTVDAFGNPLIIYHARPAEHLTNADGQHGGDPLYDPCRHARVKSVHFAADGRLVLDMTPEEELAAANKTITIQVTVQKQGGTAAQTVTVANGTADKSEAVAGDTVTITANTIDGKTFAGWTVNAGGVTLKDASAVTTTFVMGGQAVEVAANYRDNQPGEQTFTVTFDSNGGTQTAPVQVKQGERLAKPADPVRSGYTFAGWYSDENLTQAYDFDAVVTKDSTLYAKWNKKSDESGGGGSSAAPDPVKPDTTTQIGTTSDGAKVTTVTDNKTGNVTQTIEATDGVKTVVSIPKQGDVTAKITMPTGKSDATVSIPMEEAAPGMVAVLVGPDGTEQIIKKSVVLDGELRVPVNGDCQITIRDNSKTFHDVQDAAWYADSVAFATSRELFSGTSETAFSPDSEMTRAMLSTVLYRLDGEGHAADGESWYAAAVEWAKAEGISDGTDLNGAITREQLAAMLYRYAGSPPVGSTEITFADAQQVSGWAQNAIEWAAANGILTGKQGNLLDPKGNATRAEVTAMLERFVKAQA